MSTTKPRITVTMEPRAHEVLSRFSAASGSSMSQIVSQFIDVSLPSLERLVVLLERANDGPKEVYAGLAAALERADRELTPLLERKLDQADFFIGQTDTLADRVVAFQPAEEAPKRRSTPVPVTRGSGGGKTLMPAAAKRSRRGAV